jgi:hypothetical protein
MALPDNLALSTRVTDFWIMSIKKRGRDPVEVIVQPTEDAEAPDVNAVDSLRALMAFYESGEAGDEEENEDDPMFHLSDMTHKGMRSDD